MSGSFGIVPADVGMIGQMETVERAVFPDPWSAAELENGLYNRLLCNLIAIDEQGRVLGYLIGSLLPPEGEIWRLAVLPEHRRAGIGRALVDAFLETGGRRDCDRFFLEVRAGNQPAIALYTACGFGIGGCRKNYYRRPTEDALLMQKCKGNTAGF